MNKWDYITLATTDFREYVEINHILSQSELSLSRYMVIRKGKGDAPSFAVIIMYAMDFAVGSSSCRT